VAHLDGTIDVTEQRPRAARRLADGAMASAGVVEQHQGDAGASQSRQGHQGFQDASGLVLLG
jgi:hypothetical protein